MNCFGPTNGAMRSMCYLDQDGRRQDTANKYLKPRLQDGSHPNLHVLLQSQVDRILFEDKKAVGVVYRTNPTYATQDDADTTQVVKAKKMVVLSAGSMSSPLILERSGIGNPEILGRAGVPLVADVPGVGADYEDHASVMYGYRSKLEPEETLESLISGRLAMEPLIASRDGRLSWNGIDVQAKLRPSENDLASLGPQFQAAWETMFKNVPDKPLMVISPGAV